MVLFASCLKALFALPVVSGFPNLRSPILLIPLSCTYRECYQRMVHHSSNEQDQQQLQHKESRHRLLKTLWYLSKPTFLPGGLCQLVAVLCQIAMPLFVQQLLLVLESNPKSKILDQGGLYYTFGIFCSMFINAMMTHRHRHLALKTGIILRSCLVGVIYTHILKLKPIGKYGLSSGEVNTLVAIDAQKVRVCRIQERFKTVSFPSLCFDEGERLKCRPLSH